MSNYKIYIDGSHLDKQNGGRLGVGGVIVDPVMPGLLGVRGKFSEELKAAWLQKNFKSSQCSNPTAELCALLIALRRFSGLILGKCTVDVYADYIGVREWMTGKWKIKEPIIKEVKKQIDQEISRLKLDGRITYNWVRGHQKNNGDPNVTWNNYVDLLAKGEG